MISERQFYDCPELDSKLIIPDQVTSIGAYAFCQCANVTEVVIGSRVRNIGERAFASCSLKSIYIPENVETIGDGAFKCETLEKIEGKFASGDNMCLIVDNTLVQLADAKGKTLLEYTIPEGVKNIGKNVVGTLAIPVIVAVILLSICALGGRKIYPSAASDSIAVFSRSVLFSRSSGDILCGCCTGAPMMQVMWP